MALPHTALPYVGSNTHVTLAKPPRASHAPLIQNAAAAVAAADATSTTHTLSQPQYLL